MKYGLIFLFVFGTTTSLFAQSKFNLRTPDSLAFLLSISNTRVNNIPVVDVTIGNLPSGITNFKVVFPTHPEITIDQSIELKPGGSSFFEVAKVKGKYKLALVSESVTAPIIDAGTPVPTALNVAEFASDTLVVEEVKIESGQCDGVVSEADFELLKGELRETVFEMRRYEKLKVYMSSHCLRAEQVRYLLAQLNTEDLKIRLFEISVDHVFDRAKLMVIEEDIFLEKNKRRVREILGQAENK
ncbi:MAG: DUF4476 domain-containing protein [Flavobacteriales bacterium]